MNKLSSRQQFADNRALGHASLFKYAVERLRLDEAVAYMLITLARKSREVPALAAALKKNYVTASKAARLAAVITCENAERLLEFAATHSKREVEFEVARLNPSTRVNDRTKVVAEDSVQITITVSRATYENLKRAESLEARTSPKTSMCETVAASVECYLDKMDPVRKADRAMARKKKLCPGRVEENKSNNSSNLGERIDLSAEERHTVFQRDRGRCAHLDAHGKKCGSDRWVEIHHIVRVADGGSNHPSNLITLCSFHHDLVHQMEFSLDESENVIRL